MTDQAPENLRYEGNDFELRRNTPLCTYLEMGGTNPGFVEPHTALQRGYVGSWEIIDSRLYLVELDGMLESGEKVRLSSIFPGFQERAFAHWYSDAIEIPQGEVINYAGMGFNHTHERDLMLEIERGVVRNIWIRHNECADAENAQVRS